MLHPRPINDRDRENQISRNKSKTGKGKPSILGTGGSPQPTDPTSNKSPANFKEILKNGDPTSRQSKINRLMSQLDQAGQKLSHKPSLNDFFIYKDTISKLISTIHPGTHLVEKSVTRPTLQNPVAREFHQIKVINQELESLMRLIREKEKNRLSITSKVTNIKGLIVNLTR